MKELKDYIHLYLGCECSWKDSRTNDTGKGILTGISNTMAEIDSGNFITECMPFEVTPHLRILDSITIPEQDYIDNLKYDADSLYHSPKERAYWEIKMWSAITNFLRGQGIDCDGLIDAGLALDKDTLEK